MNARDLLLMRNRADSLHALRDAFRGNVPGLHLVALTEQQNAVYQLMWQDSAGTTLVSAVEQPVGKWVCPYTGRFVSQPSAGARLTYTRRVNVLRGTEALTGGDWLANGSGVVTAGFSDPDGGTTAFRIVTSTSALNSGIYQNGLTATSASQREAVWLRGNVGGERVQIGDATSRTTVTLTTSWQRFTGTAAKLSANFVIYSDSLAQTWFAWRPDSRPASIAAINIPAYQRVTSSTDYDTEGFPCMVKGNGTSQWMSGTLDMSSTDKVLVVAGVTKYSDAEAALCELTASSSANNGSFAMFAPGSAAPRFFWRSRGTAGADADSASSFAAPYPAVVTGQGDIAADVSTLRVNGASAASSATDQGTGNYANSTLYLLSRGGTGSWSSAGITSLTIRGGDGAAWVSRLENYVKNLMRLNY